MSQPTDLREFAKRLFISETLQQYNLEMPCDGSVFDTLKELAVPLTLYATEERPTVNINALPVYQCVGVAKLGSWYPTQDAAFGHTVDDRGNVTKRMIPAYCSLDVYTPDSLGEKIEVRVSANGKSLELIPQPVPAGVG